MQHPLRQARPADPFLRFNFDPSQVLDYRIDGDHVGYVRPGRRGGEAWVSALGDDPDRVVTLIDALSEGREVDGIHVHDDVYAALPDRLTIDDPGHWSIWVMTRAEAIPDLADVAVGPVELDAADPRIDPLLAHSDSAYIFAGHDSVRRWAGVIRDERLLAVGAESVIADGVPHLVSICTDPDARGQGLGRSVTAHLAQAAFDRGEPLVYLEMYAGNAPAAALYRSLGFREVGRYRSGWLPGRAVR